MPWYFPWSDSIKKRACRYILQHYLGHFFKEKLTLDQLSVDLYNGRGTIQEVLLDVVSLNEALENFNAPVEVVDGFIGSISVSIPWSALVNDNTVIEVRNLELTIQSKRRSEHADGHCPGATLDSMLSSMTTSLQLAEECLKEEPSSGEQMADAAKPFEGLEMFAQTIEAVLTRVKVSFIDTIVRLEHLPREAKTGAAVEFRIGRIEYFDELAMETGEAAASPTPGARNVYEPAAIALKNIRMYDVTVCCEEFPECHRTFSKTSSSDSSSPGNYKFADAPLSPLFTSIPSAVPEFPAASSAKETEPVKIAVLRGRHEIKLRIKQSESLHGPKLEVEGQFGAINVHLSPRQVHLLIEIVKGLSMPGVSDDGSVPPGQRAGSKPMQNDDFRRVEQELANQLHHGKGAGVPPRLQAWQGAEDAMLLQSLGDSEDEDLYFDFAASRHSGVSSLESSCSSSITMSSSRTTGVPLTSQTRRQRQQSGNTPTTKAKQKSAKHKETLRRLLDDPTAELMRYRLKLSFMSVVVLHEDPPATPGDRLDVGQTSAEKLKSLSEAYYGRVEGIVTSGMAVELSDLRRQFSQACRHDHISLLCKPVTVECNQKMTSQMDSMTSDIAVGSAELVEAVFDRLTMALYRCKDEVPTPEYCELLTFSPDGVEPSGPMYSSMQALASPCVHITIQTVSKKHQTSRRSSVAPSTELHMELAKCQSELDITIVDRIHELLNPQPLVEKLGMSGLHWSGNPTFYQSAQNCFNQALDEDASVTDHILDLKVTSSLLTCYLRFPVPDLRPSQGIDKPWWRRCLQKEILIVKFTDIDVHTCVNASSAVSKVDVTCKEAHGLFQTSPEQGPVSFCRINSTAQHGRDDGFDWPQFVITIFPQAHSSVLEEEIADMDELLMQNDSLNGACQFVKPPPSPFSSRKAMYENEELVMPADRQEMCEFQDKSVAKTRLLLEFSLPSVVIVLPDKEFFELLYNRTLNDLVIWEPVAPEPLPTQDPCCYTPSVGLGLDLASQMQHQSQHQMEMFSLCKSSLQYDSSSDSEDGSGQHYSIVEQKERYRRRQLQEQQPRQSRMCVSLNIAQGRITGYVPHKSDEGGEKGSEQSSTEKGESSTGKGESSTGKGESRTEKGESRTGKAHGEFTIDIEDGLLFAALQCDGDPDLQQLCIVTHNATLWHEGTVSTTTTNPLRDQTGCRPTPGHLNATLYPSERGIHARSEGQSCGVSDGADTLCIAIKVQNDRRNKIKEYQVALGLRGTTLRHHPTQPGLSWISHLMEMFNVVDYPVLGYTPPKIVTELHTHMWGCAIDYRPLSLPYRAVLTMETFSISSNIIADSPTSLLRFLIDDAALYISDKCDADAVDLRKNYVCVVDVGMFELSLRTSDGRDTRYPKLDLRASNNIVHLRMCADSCRALALLLNYLATDGDLVSRTESDSKPKTMTSSHSSLSDSPHVSQTHLDQVHSLMADAMKESNSSGSDSDNTEISQSPESQTPTEIFFFPDERQARSAAPSIESIPDSTRTLLEEATMERECHQSPVIAAPPDDIAEYSGDDEYCIINTPGLGVSSRDGEPKIRCLTSDPIAIVDNHFSMSLGQSDQLRSPGHFPGAVLRYTLREMSLVWYMYGGNDFESTNKKGRYKAASSAGVKVRRRSGQGYKMGKVGWQARGGPQRDIDVLVEFQLNKIRVQHEVFPENTEQASRQILLISEIEIRDRLTSSKINKFLYQYTSDALPRQSHANMLMVKLTHVRPDPTQPAQECSLKVSLQPLRLNVDQDALFFLRSFFLGISADESKTRPSSVVSQSETTPSHQPRPLSTPPPVMSVGSVPASGDAAQELYVKFDELSEGDDGEMELEEDPTSSQPVFFKSFVFSPDVPVRLDYHGKRVDMEQGTLVGLIIGLAQLNCSELKLKRLHHRHGLLGFDRLIKFALTEWLSDITKNQLPSILGGVGPMHSLVQIVQGVRDLFWLPVEQYQRDGRIMRGLQRGAHSFVTCTAMSALELTNRVVQVIQFAGEITFDMLAPGPSMRCQLKHRRRRYQYQLQRHWDGSAAPADLREGVTNAYMVVREGIKGTAANIVKVAVEEHELKGMRGAVGGVLRQIPPTIVQPVIIATEATSSILGGMRNQLLPDKKREDEEKWKPEED